MPNGYYYFNFYFILLFSWTSYSMASESDTSYRVQPVCSAHLYQICFQGDSDAQVTLEDQQKINKFARHNAKLQDIKEELKQKEVLHSVE